MSRVGTGAHLPPGAEVPQAPEVSFTLDGVEYRGRQGEPLAVALWAAGVRRLGTSEQRMTPRGIYCAIGHCFECRLSVDGQRDQRACLVPLKVGLRAERQQPPAPLVALPLTEDEVNG